MKSAPQPSKSQSDPKAKNEPVEPQSPTHQRPPTDNERRGGTEQDEKVRRSNLAGDEDTDDPVETEEG